MHSARDFADLFANQPFGVAAIQFLPAWLLALFTGSLAESSRTKDLRGRSLACLATAEGSSGLRFLALLLWAGISALRTCDFWNMMAWSHGPEIREMYVVAMSNLGAGAITCCVIVAVLTARRRPAARLGLRGMQYFVSMALILVTLIDSATIFAAIYLFSRPAGLPLPMSIVH